ncbi:MAG: type II secretion system protein GspN [Candidatus Binatia bacterium]
MIRLPQLRAPRLRLPPLRLSFDWLGNLGGRRTALYAGYTAVLFLLFLLVTFPHELVVRRALSGARGPAAIDFSGVRFAWFSGYEIDGVRVTSVDGQTPYLECSRLWVRPALAALLRGNPYDFLLRAELYGGDANGEVRIGGSSMAGTLQWKDLSLGRYRTLTAILDEGQLAGRVSGAVNFEGRAPNLNPGQGTGELVVEGAALTGAKIAGFPVPDLRLRQTKAKFTVREGRLEVQEFQATGDVDVQASGNIVFRDPPEESMLNLRVTIQSSLATPDAVKTLVGLIPRPPGAKPDAPITVTGTLARPHVR